MPLLLEDDCSPGTDRDDSNLRVRGSATVKFEKKFLANGLYKDLRGKLQARYARPILPGATRGVCSFISGGTLQHSVHRARASEPNNVFVKRLLPLTQIKHT